MIVRRLHRFRIVSSTEANLSSPRGDEWWIWADGSRKYARKLADAFPEISIQFFDCVTSPDYSWCLRLSAVSAESIRLIERCLQLFQKTLWIESDLDECFALDWHSKSNRAGKPPLTALGQWVRMAKSYNLQPGGEGSVTIAGLIADQMVEFIVRHPRYHTAQGIVSVLPSNPEKTFDLPALLAEKIASDTGIPYLRYALYKKRLTAQMKFCITLDDKWDNIAESVGVRTLEIRGKNLIIIDDIFESGITLTETARTLRADGARNLYGLTATKTLKTRFK